MVLVIQWISIVQIPATLTICIDLWSGCVLISISRDNNLGSCTTAVHLRKMKCLSIEDRSFLKKYLISRFKIHCIYLCQSFKCIIFGSTCCIFIGISIFGINIICCSCCSVLSFSINSNCRRH